MMAVWAMRMPARMSMRYAAGARLYSSAQELAASVNTAQPLDLKTIPEGAPRHFKKHMDATGTTDLLIRDTDVKLNAELDNAVENGVVTRKGMAFCLRGPRKCGKTATMLRLVEQRRKSGWLVLYMNAWDWTNGPTFFNPGFKGLDERKALAEPVFYDRPMHTLALFQSLKSAHGELLGSLPITLSPSVQAEAGAESLLDLVNYGEQLLEKIDEDWFSIPQRAGDILEALIEEIIAVQDVPVLIAVDNFGSFFGVSGLHHRDGGRLISQAFRVSWPLRVPVETAKRMKNGCYVVSLSTRHYPIIGEGDIITGCRTIPATPDLLKRLHKQASDYDHINLITRGIGFDVPRWTVVESRSLLRHLSKVGVVGENFTSARQEYMHVYTQGNPEELVQICKTL